MNKMKTNLTQADVLGLFLYDASTGVFTNRKGRGPARKDAIAGTVNSRGYVIIRINKINYCAHRLAWLYVHGEWPDKYIDHVNGNKADNRINNLRVVSQSENLQNVSRPHADNKSGCLGAIKNKNRWTARISINGVNHNLGSYATPEEANSAYLKAKKEIHSAWVDCPAQDIEIEIPEGV